MHFSTVLPALAILSAAVAQSFSLVTDENGITFWQTDFDTGIDAGNAQFGIVLPPATQTDLAADYLGRLVVPRPASGTWMGYSHQSGMTGALMLLTWVNGEEVMTDFRYASGYTAPAEYTGNSTLTTISSSVNATHYEITYRCQDCWAWDQDGETGSQLPATTADAVQLIGWAQATVAPTSPDSKTAAIQQHANADVLPIAAAQSARNIDFTKWMTKTAAGPTSVTTTAGSSISTSLVGINATMTDSPSGTGTSTVATPTATIKPAACAAANVTADTTYDYIIVGSGAGGITLAAKLAASGRSVLLIERGPASTGRFGGQIKPDWLVGTNLTRFDVPGLDNQIWKDS
jgi:cellobiose dehydrogenase (acceptor)